MIIQGKIWWKETVVYQIYPRSFNDSNGDGIGDIPGIIEKLGYLKNLGVDVIWISPMYESPNDDNGYDISDYQNIMKDFGSMEEFDELLEKAHKLGMKIIMDLVVNHTSDEHSWFIESRQAKESEYKDYYIWKEGKEGQEPNNWGSWFGGSAWKYDEIRKEYYLHIFSGKQPDLNWDNEKVREEIYQMMTWWLDKGIDGFRMDVISLISKDPRFSDGVLYDGLYGDLAPGCVHGPHVHEYLKEMNEKVLSKYDILTVGEAAGVTIEEAKKYAGYDSKELNTIFQFEHVDRQDGKNGKWNDKKIGLVELKEIFTKWQKEMEGKSWNCLFWSNHDQPRAVSRFGNDSPQYRTVSAKMLATCLHFQSGTPYIYQGEELGMTNAYFETLEEYKDIETFNAYDKLVNKLGVAPEKMITYMQMIGRDNARTPMQWDASENAGFTTGTPWLSVNRNYLEINASEQIKDEQSVFNYYKKLIQIRHENDIVVYGSYDLLMPESEEIYAYTRTLGEEKLLVLCNFTERDVDFEMPVEFPQCKLDRMISNYGNDLGDRLRPYEAKVYKRVTT